MKFEKVSWNGLHKVVTEVEYESLDHVKTELNERFNSDDNVARYEEMKMGNGKTSVSLKDRGNKIITQIKTI